MLGGRDAAAEDFFDRTGTALQQARVHHAAGNVRALTDWVNRRAVRTHPGLWDLSPASVRLWLDAHPEAETGEAVLPPGLDIHRALSARGRPPQHQSWRLVQRGNWLEIEPAAASAPRLASGSPLGAQLHTNLPVIAAREERPDAPWRSLGLNRDPGRGEGVGDVAALALDDTGWRVRTDYEELVIAPMERPAWADTLGRDGDGLFVRFKDGQGEWRADWCAPLEWLDWPDSPTRSEASPWDGHGCFIDHDQYQALRARGLAPEDAGLSLHSDRFGLRAEIVIAGVPIGLRWIWPGEFLRGSPATEPGRYDDETRHQVILTRGFWLAETACTQALWQAVMRENPSYRKGPQRPVEQVSWEDVRGFIARLNGEQARSARRTLGFRLPTEAEWEYACRAGTATAYSFGDEFDSKLANIGGETVAVRSLPPNPWGLYEMHGNVYEWCQDWFGDYPTDPVVDPQGPDSGERRVLRGGGWFREAQVLRSAARLRNVPGHRFRRLGFRLALGPEPRPAGSGAGLPAPGASGSERKARAVWSRGGRNP